MILISIACTVQIDVADTIPLQRVAEVFYLGVVDPKRAVDIVDMDQDGAVGATI